MSYTLPDHPRPSYPATETTKPVMRGTRFGTGPENRRALGLNQFPATIPVQWPPVPLELAKVLTNFFEARARANQAFRWTPPDRPLARWRCRRWSMDGVGRGLFTVQATFEQVFDLE